MEADTNTIRQQRLHEASAEACHELRRLMKTAAEPGFFATGMGVTFETRNGVIGIIRIQRGEETRHVG